MKTNNWLNRIIKVLTIILLSILIPQVLFTLKYSLDQTEYYKIMNPLQTDNSDYYACNQMDLTVHRVSTINTSAVSIRELVLVKKDDMYDIEVYKEKQDIVLENTEGKEETIKIKFTLPCNINSGTYLWRGVVVYTVHGIEKQVKWYSTEFVVLL